MKSHLLIAFLLFSQFGGMAQEGSQEAAVHAIIQQLFKGMYEGDSMQVKAVFHPHAAMATTYFTKENTPGVRMGDVQQFISRVGTPHDEVWDEQIENLQISIDDNLAQAWMDYYFYVGDTFSHCGVNTMTLVHTPEGWRILYLADSRRKSPCERNN